MFTAAVAMSKSKEEKFCTYTSIKIDDEVARLIRGAAGLAGQSVQDWASDILNDAAAKALNMNPVKRRKVRRPKDESTDD